FGKDTSFDVFDKVSYPHSLGIFYTAFTQYLGFPHYGDEYKVMGLAPYGQPNMTEKVWKVIDRTSDGLFRLNLDYFTHSTSGVKMTWDGGMPDMGTVFSPVMEELFGPARKNGEQLLQCHKDLAASVQRCTEEVIFHLAESLYKKIKVENLCLAGGVAQNSVANGKIIKNTSFKNLYIPPAAHDAGTSIGSALYQIHQVLKIPRQPAMMHGYFGSRFEDSEIEKVLIEKNIRYQKLTDSELFEQVSDNLISGCVVGWFQGRAEFGPRALGHRSILADPRRTDAKDLLNNKIKRRESFRPFAPSILKEHIHEYFDQGDEVPFMEKVFLIKEHARSKIPAVSHVDGTGRLQSVDQKIEPRYYNLINAFYRKTSVPILLNTSFNENEPIVNTPAEALDCYLRTQMDVLVLENYVVRRDTKSH
ncbi:MAG: carbamoyltransferase, partial [Sphingobacteriales bacterium]